MTLFDCFLLGSWAFAFGWFFGAIYVQNQKEEPPGLGLAKKAERTALLEIPMDAVSSSATAD
jgi:hypothetical protein